MNSSWSLLHSAFAHACTFDTSRCPSSCLSMKIAWDGSHHGTKDSRNLSSGRAYFLIRRWGEQTLQNRQSSHKKGLGRWKARVPSRNLKRLSLEQLARNLKTMILTWWSDPLDQKDTLSMLSRSGRRIRHAGSSLRAVLQPPEAFWRKQFSRRRRHSQVFSAIVPGRCPSHWRTIQSRTVVGGIEEQLV